MLEEVEDRFLQDISQLESQLAKVRSHLHAIRETRKKQGDPCRKFYNERPLDAARALIKEHGGRLKPAELQRLMDEGGINVGRSRSDNFDMSLKKNLDLGNLVINGEFIELPTE